MNFGPGAPTGLLVIVIVVNGSHGQCFRVGTVGLVHLPR
jgi:hypothetical protein